ncbi:MAG: hypothetical protein RBT70_08815 [Alphaproteobacteria bacterium]|jgi:hypothetical protein|nr:hypothetical protein [Alphaproteobacteria bacterium]
MTTETTATPAASDAATPAAAPVADTATPAAATQDSGAQQPSGADTPAADGAAAAAKDSGKDAQAQGADQPEAGEADKDSQSSNDQDPTDTDKDADGEDKKEGNQDAQKPAYEQFTMPEGMELDEVAMNEATPLLQELGANQEQAQKLVDVAASMLSKAAKNMADQHAAVVEGWRKESMELFGNEGEAKFLENVGRAEEVVKHFFDTDEKRQVLTHYGLGNHPGFFAMCMAIAERTGEDRPFVGMASGQQGQKSLAQKWYPAES